MALKKDVPMGTTGRRENADALWCGVIDDDTLSGSEKLVLLSVLRLKNGDGTSQVPISQIAAHANLERRHAQRIVGSLKVKGKLEVIPRAGQSNLFRFVESGESDRGVTQDTPVMQDAPGGVMEDTPHHVRQAPSNGASSQREFSDAAYRLFAERYQGKKPTWGPKHFVQLAALLSIRPDLTVIEFSERYKNFLGSPVPYHSQHKGSLAFFCPNFDEFIEPIAAETGRNYGANRDDERRRRTVKNLTGFLKDAG